MADKARWGPFSFEVTANKIIPFENLTTSFTVKTDSQNTSNVTGLEPQPMTFTTTYIRSMGVDPREKIDAWKAEMGKSYPLYIGEKRFGPEKMMLIGVNVSELITDNSGAFLSAIMDISLREYIQNASTSSASSGQSSSAAKARAKYDEVTQKKKAMNATASTPDKVTKKPATK